MVKTYTFFQMDIRPKGCRVIRMDGCVTDDTVRQTRRVPGDEPLRREMVDRNDDIAGKCRSCRMLNRKPGGLIQGRIACRL